MLTISPVLPFPMLLAYTAASAIALCLHVISFAAIFRTRTTPYPSKLLSLGLLVYDGLFVISANVGKLFPHEENFAFRHFSRGCQTAAFLIVVFMSFERLFVLNWPNVFLRVGTRGRIRKVCLAIIIISFLQYVLFQGLVCYSRRKIYGCGVELAVYYLFLTITGYTCSISSYIKVFKIIRNKSLGFGMSSLKENKGTYTSFVYLVNNVILGCAYISGAIYFAIMAANGTLTGQEANILDAVYLVNSIIDPLIYVVWFKEVRMEILSAISKLCPCLKPTVEKMRREVFNISTFQNVQKDEPMKLTTLELCRREGEPTT